MAVRLHLVRTLIGLAATALILAVVMISPVGAKLPFYTYYAAYATNSQICAPRDARKGLDHYLRHYREADRLAGHVRQINRDDGLVLWSTPVGEWWFPEKATEDLVRYAVAQHTEDAYQGLAVQPGDVVLDCGGFIGDYTMTALRAGAAKVVVAEPSEEALKCIRLNLAEQIRQGKVIVYPKGIWNSEGRLWLGNNPENPEDKAIGRNHAGEGEWIDVTTVDRLVAELKLQKVDVIKFDIEGAESVAVEGARNTLHQFRPRVAIATEHTNHRLQNNRNVIAAMQATAPFYVMRCGFCYIKDGEGIIPETLYFKPE